MSKHAFMISAALVGLMAAGPALAKSELYGISNVSGAILTTIYGINDSGIATGSWLDTSSIEHGYVGSPDGSDYTTFDDPKEAGPGTEPRGISNGGYICGFGDSSKRSASSHDTWERDDQGNIEQVTKRGTVLNDLCQGLNSSEEFAGSYVNSSSATVAYLGENDKYSKAVTLKGIKNGGVAARGVDDAGDIVGWYYDAETGLQHGFLITGGTASTIDFTGATYTALEGINNKGQATGQYEDSSGVIHGFIYTIATKAFKNIRVPGSASFVQAWGINDMGQVAIGSDAGYYVYCPSSRHCSFGGRHASVAPARDKPQVKPHPMLP